MRLKCLYEDRPAWLIADPQSRRLTLSRPGGAVLRENRFAEAQDLLFLDGWLWWERIALNVSMNDQRDVEALIQLVIVDRSSSERVRADIRIDPLLANPPTSSSPTRSSADSHHFEEADVAPPGRIARAAGFDKKIRGIGGFLAASDAERFVGDESTDSPDVAPLEYVPGDEVFGNNGRIRVANGLIQIHRGLKEDVFVGNLRGTKTIPVRSVQAVQFKRSTKFNAGMIEFVVAGEKSNTGQNYFGGGIGGETMSNSSWATALFGRQMARLTHENIITFTPEQQPAFLGLHQYLLSQISPAPPTETGPASTPINLAEQLERLHALRLGGVLTSEEFTAAKNRLLGA